MDAMDRPHTPGSAVLDRRGFVKGLVLGAAALLAPASLSGCSGVEGFLQSPAVTQASMRVGIDCAHPAYEMLVDSDAKGSLPLENSDYRVAGFDVAYLGHIAEALAFTPRVVDVDHSDLADYLKRGYIDMALSSVFNGSNDTGLAFSDPYAPVELAVACRADSPFSGATSLEQLAGAHMAARSDTDYDRAISQIPGAVHAAPYGSRTYPCLKVAAGEIDATVVDRRGFEESAALFPELALAPIPADRCPTPDQGPLRIAVRREDSALLERLNAIIAEVSDEDALQMWRDAKEASPQTVLVA